MTQKWHSALPLPIPSDSISFPKEERTSLRSYHELSVSRKICKSHGKGGFRIKMTRGLKVTGVSALILHQMLRTPVRSKGAITRSLLESM